MAGSRGKGTSVSAPKKAGGSSGDAPPFLRAAAEWKGYVNVEIDEGTKAQFQAFIADAGLVREITAEVLLRGYKLSSVQVDNDATVRATAIAGFKGTVDAGYAVSAWAEDFYEATAAVVFIVAVLSGFNLSQHVKEAEARYRRTF